MVVWRKFHYISGALGVLLSLWSAWGYAQTTPINGNLVVVGTENYCDTAGSATNTYVCALGYTITVYIDGASYLVAINADNTGAATLNLNGIGAKTIKKKIAGVSVDLIAGDLKTGDKARVVYDGTNMQLHSPVSSATNANTASTLVYRDSSGNFSAGTISAALTGNSSTATALFGNGANCTVAGTFPNGVDASGVSENCTPLSTVVPKTATYPIVVGDFNTYTTFPVASGTFSMTLPAAANQPTNGKYVEILNYGSGVITVARTDTNLNGGTTSLVLAPGTALVPTSMRVTSDGTNYFARPAFGNPMTTAGDFLYGGTSGAPTRLAAGTGFVTGNGASVPTFTTPPTGALVGTGQANTWTTGAQDMGSATSFKVPTSAGAAPTASGLLAYDSTANTLEVGVNGANAQVSLNPMTAAGDFVYGGTSGAPTRLAAGTGFLYANGASAPTLAKFARGLSFSFGDPAGNALTVGDTTTDYLATVPFACTLSAWDIVADAGTVTVKLWRVNGGTAIPTSANSLNTSGISLASGTAVHSTTMSDFTSTSVSAGDRLAVNITAVATAKAVNVVLQCDQ